MTIEEISPLVSKLGALPYFPADVDARIAIAVVLLQCAGENLGRIDWTVSRCLQLWDKWEGPHELRAVLCSRFPPADGLDAYSRLPQFPDGIPSESESRNQELLGAGEQKRLDPGSAFQLLRDARSMTPVPRPRDAVDEISEHMDRERAVKHATLPDDDEISRIKAEQARNRKESA